MKKFSLIFLVFTLLLSLFVSCKQPEPPLPEEDVFPELPSEYKESVQYYFLRSIEGYQEYIKAFPSDYIEGMQKMLGYDDETFKKALDNSTNVVHSNIAYKYADSGYFLEYAYLGENEMELEEKKDLISELQTHCYITPGTILDVKELSFEVVTYGLRDSETRVYEETERVEVNIVNISDEGWRIAPNEFEY